MQLDHPMQAFRLDVEEIEAAGGRAIAYGVDARDEDQVTDLVDRIEREVGPIEVAVFNIGANVHFSVLETTARGLDLG